MKITDKKSITQGQKKWVHYIEVLWHNANFLEDLRMVKAISEGSKKQKAILSLANKYHLSYPVMDQFLNPQGDDEPRRNYETDQGDGMVIITKTKTSTDKSLEMQMLANSYPVTLAVSKVASKRDVIDYIDKKWAAAIEPLLREAEPNPPRLKPRHTVFRDFIISGFADEGIEKVREMCQGLFPEIVDMDDQDLYSLMSKEKRRHPERKGPTDSEGR